MEINQIAIVSDWGTGHPAVLYLQSQLKRIFPKTEIFILNQNIRPFFALESVYFVRKALNTLGEGSMVINLCNIHRQQNPRFSLFTTGKNSILSLDHTAYSLYDESQTEIKASKNLHYKSSQEFADEILQFLQNIGSYSLQSEAPSRDYMPRMTRNGIQSQILHIDSFENIITNLSMKTLHEEVQNGSWRLEISKIQFKFKINGWLDAEDGEKICFFNSAGLLKLGRKNGILASTLGYSMGAEQYMSGINIPIFIDYDN